MTDDPSTTEAGQRAAMSAEVDAVLASGIFGRSTTLGQLLRYLLKAALDGVTPKEIEVARAVFAREDIQGDASVRVYVLRLRAKLEAYYRDREAGAGPRLVIPKGGYRLLLYPGEAAPPPAAGGNEDTLPVPAASPGSPRKRWIVAGFAAANLLVLVLAFLVIRAQPADAVRATPFWSLLARHDRPLLVVVGDYYLFGETRDGQHIDRLIREFGINSPRDLDRRIIAEPTLADRYVDLGLHYLPTGATRVLNEILPIAKGPRDDPMTMHVITASELTPTTIRANDIVYLGYLSGLGALRDTVLGNSRFTADPLSAALIDRRTGRRFATDYMKVLHGGTPTTDYAYLASLPGPAGSHIVVVAGLRDPGLRQAGEIASSLPALRAMAMLAGRGQAVEALYRVDGVRDQNFSGRLVLASAR